jgi:phosphatidylserine/phosphatidylglycerophosphate/cardiolipin synthase-like enzyme
MQAAIPTAAGARFALLEEELSDGSMVYNVRFHCDYDLEASVTIDCEDEAKAHALIEALQAAAVSIWIQAPAQLSGLELVDAIEALQARAAVLRCRLELATDPDHVRALAAKANQLERLAERLA